MRTIIEPFRIKSVEPIRRSTRAEREQANHGISSDGVCNGARPVGILSRSPI